MHVLGEARGMCASEVAARVQFCGLVHVPAVQEAQEALMAKQAHRRNTSSMEWQQAKGPILEVCFCWHTC